MPTPSREGTLFWRGILPEGANECWYQEYQEGRIVVEFYTETHITAVVSSRIFSTS